VRAEGAEAIAALVNGARPLAEFAFDTLVREHGLTLAGKNKIVGELKALIREAADPQQRALMAAHFSGKLGVSPGYFLPGRQGVQIPASKDTSPAAQGLTGLARQEKQLIDFLLIHPEYFHELKQAGLDRVVEEPSVVRFMWLLEQACGDGPCQPEHLLEFATDPGDRAYIAHILTKEESAEIEQEREPVRKMYDELAQWLHMLMHRRSAASLQEQINQAESLGNTRLLMDLLRKKQEFEQKRRGL
jgi:DNA primase